MPDNVSPPGDGAPARGLFGELFGVDLRSLAAMRIATGLVVLADLALRARHFGEHYTDLGGAPRDVVLERFGASARLSLHYWLGGSPALEAAVFVLHGLAAAALVAGFRTRIATAACWYLTASLLTRTPMLHTVGDRTLQLVLFWSLFLPLGARWSLDARRDDRLRGASNTYVSAAGFAILMQICLIYWAATAHKLLTDMWPAGDAVAFALNLDAYSTGPGAWLRRFEGLLPLLTWMTLGLEALGPLLPFVPGFTTPGRLIAVGSFTLLHAAFGVFLRLDIFPYMSAAAWLVFLPGAFWDRVSSLCHFARHPASQSESSLGQSPRCGGHGHPGHGGSRSDVATSQAMRPRRIESALACAFLALVLALNLCSFAPLRRLLPGPAATGLVSLGSALRLRQSWGMFTFEESINGWFVVAGHLAGGGEVDLLAGRGPVSFDPPLVAGRAFGSARRLQFFYAHRELDKSPFWKPWAEHACRTWNRTHHAGERLERVTIWFMRRDTSFLGEQSVKRFRLLDHPCGPAEFTAEGRGGPRRGSGR